MNINIESIATGYLLIIDGDKYAYDNFTDVLCMIRDLYEPGSRNDKKRIYIIEAPGDKHPDFTEAHIKVLWSNE